MTKLRMFESILHVLEIGGKVNSDVLQLREAKEVNLNE